MNTLPFHRLICQYRSGKTRKDVPEIVLKSHNIDRELSNSVRGRKTGYNDAILVSVSVDHLGSY